jgi:glutathione S-transferase
MSRRPTRGRKKPCAALPPNLISSPLSSRIRPTPSLAICLSALATDKQDRHADCNEMAMALQAWLARNAPTIGDTRMASFIQELFADDILCEREELDKLSGWAESLLGRA